MPGGGPRPVDYLGIPLNDVGRAWSLIYSQSQISMPERICDYYAPTYIVIGPIGLRIWPESEMQTGSTRAWIIGGLADFVPIPIWMAGGRIRRTTQRTRSRVLPPASGKTTCL